MSRHRILVALSVGVFGLADVGVLAQSTSGGGLTGGPPGRQSERTKRRTRRVQFFDAFAPSDTHRFGDSFSDLTIDQLFRFETGRALFEEVQTVDAGLGPMFSARSCTGCHSAPVSAGAGDSMVLRIARRSSDSTESSVLEVRGIEDDCMGGGSLRPDHLAVRATTAVFGAGLIDAISDADILAREDPDDLDGDGISGRANIVVDAYDGVSRVGRFGWKAQTATLESFTAESMELHMGITTRLSARREGPNGAAVTVLNDCDSVADPEDAADAAGISDFERISEYLRLLAPPPQKKQNNASGLALFQQIGCSGCHTAVMFTEANDIAALSRRPVTLFSDLLLHDMGDSGDGIVQAGADGNEMRTAPLWGLRVRPALWHDGRFSGETRIRDAIEAHLGEGTQSRDLWIGMSESGKRALLEFLNSI